MKKKQKENKNKSGITLIALIITIIVLLILAGASISMLAGDNGILTRSSEAKVQTAIASKKEEVAFAINEELITNSVDLAQVTISKVIEKIKKNYSATKEKEAISSEPLGEDEDKFPAQIIFDPPASTIAESIVITVNEDLSIGKIETAVTGLKPTASTYTQIGKVFCNSPDLSGFNPKCTYYITYDTNSKPINQGRLDQTTAPEDWYDYENKLWANVVTINNGNTTYWTWIPRFKYKTPSDDSSIPAQTTDVKFVGEVDGKKDVCIVEKDGQITTVDVSSYKLSDAFTFGGKELKGYWVSKFRMQEGTNDGTADKSLSNIEVDLSGFNPNVTKYVEYNENGSIKSEDTKIQLDASGKATNMPKNWYNYQTKNWANVVTDNNGNKTYWTYIPRYEYKAWSYMQRTESRFITTDTTTADTGYVLPDAFKFGDKDLKGYWVSKFRMQEGTNDGSADTSLSNIQIDLSGFNQACTYYVTYNTDGTVKDETKLISTKAPDDWYDYKNKKWANVMTNNNGLKTYWTYVPRYEYQAWTYMQRTNLRFITTDTTTAQSGFKIPDAFKFGDKDLKGYWVSKYRMQESGTNTEFNGTYYTK